MIEAKALACAWFRDRNLAKRLVEIHRLSIVRASCGIAGRASCLAQASAATRTSSALLFASRSLLMRMLSSRPVRTAPAPRANTQFMTVV